MNRTTPECTLDGSLSPSRAQVLSGDTADVLLGHPPRDRRPNRAVWTGMQVLALLVITVGSFWLAFNPGWIQQFSQWGYLSVFLASLISSATVILPVPGIALVFAMGGSLDPVTLGIVAGVGSALGELSGYVAGASGSRLMRQEDRLSRVLRRLTTRYTAPVLFILAVLPLPIFDFAGILAGAMGMPVTQFLGVVASGKIVKHTLIALMGAGSLQILHHYFGL